VIFELDCHTMTVVFQAALFAIEELFKERKQRCPVFVSNKLIR